MLWMMFVPLMVPAFALLSLRPTFALLLDWRFDIILAGVLSIAWAAGWFISIVVGWPIIGPFYMAAGERNGAPFQIGDQVVLLTRAHRGRVAVVTQVRHERGSMLVTFEGEGTPRPDEFGDPQVRRVEINRIS